ncbi:response regulator transcription factor [Campylobacter suis]|uniref:Transcriptional activator protein CzcR n=1 Tax=Campylobacter suis TaxID=2790657 RepID=A0ABM8Q9I4_9BACT|nr:response regulator [Campylobacter suis]CAD7289425.1 Transcriptional activator protein CzcR [Campylobacter suis]
MQTSKDILSKLSILIVEDDRAAQLYLKSGLKAYCNNIIIANDGYEGLESFNKHNFDVVLTDIHMPAMNGFEMMKNILKIKPHQKFIIFTSYDTDVNLVKSVEAGAAMFLKKPIDIQTLRYTLLSIVGTKEQKDVRLSDIVSIDIQNERIFKNGEEIYLSFLQNKLFWLFAYNLNKLVSYEMISEYVYENEPVSKKAIQNMITRLKKEIDISIQNIPESGYIMYAE